MREIISLIIVALMFMSGCASKRIVAKDCREIQNGYFECEEP